MYELAFLEFSLEYIEIFKFNKSSKSVVFPILNLAFVEMISKFSRDNFEILEFLM